MAGGAAIGGADTGNPMRDGFITRPFLWAFMLVTSLFFLWGFCYGLLDVLNKHFQTVLGITKLESTLLQVAYFGGGYLIYSPVAAEILRRFGYKVCIIQGLCFYSIGAIMFWPVAHFAVDTTKPKAIFGGFVVCTFIIACGLASLEVAANSYVSVMPPLNTSQFRLNFSQSFNGVASFAGPLIASKYFFTGENANNLTNVQYVYAAVAGMGVMIIVAFVATKLPEVSESALIDAQEATAAAAGLEQVDRGFWRTKAPFGFAAQFMYVAAQVGIGSFFLNLSDEAGIADAHGSKLLSYGLILFTVGRFFGTALLSVINAPLLLAVYASIVTALLVVVSVVKGPTGVYLVMIIMFFESIMYPTIFVLGTSNLGRHTRRSAGLLVQGVAGGMVWPPLMGAIADAKNTRTAYWVCVPCFIVVGAFALFEWNAAGRKIRADKPVPALEEENDAQAYANAQNFNGRQSTDKNEYEMDRKANDMDYVERI